MEQQTIKVTATFNDIDWITIFFFIGLFVIVHGVDAAGILDLAAQRLLAADRRRPGHDRRRHPVGLGRSSRRSSTTSRSSRRWSL